MDTDKILTSSNEGVKTFPGAVAPATAAPLWRYRADVGRPEVLE
jgi:hypothetical protein